MGNGRRGSHARRPVPSGRQSRHEGRGPALRRLVRRPAAAAMLCCGLLAVGGGTGGILLLTGHGVIGPRPVAHPGPPAGRGGGRTAPAGNPARVARPVYLSIPVIGVHTRLIKLGLTARAPSRSRPARRWRAGTPAARGRVRSAPRSSPGTSTPTWSQACSSGCACCAR